jgi:hypothetical protein
MIGELSEQLQTWVDALQKWSGFYKCDKCWNWRSYPATKVYPYRANFEIPVFLCRKHMQKANAGLLRSSKRG